jgi:signal transduction histidine kinase
MACLTTWSTASSRIRAASLWLSTNKGLSRFEPATRQFRNYDADDGLQSNEFNSGAAFRSRSGELFFGGIYGFNYFRPEDVHDNPNVPAVAITGFRRGNRSETVRDSGTVLRTTISEADTLRLSYRDAVLTFEFAALEYSAPSKNRYAYRLVGFNDDWFESGSVRAATYTNLPPGHYRFQVRASNNDGVWNEQGASLALLILPPWWRTWWAYALYGALALAALYGARHSEVSRLRLKNRLEIERVEAEQLRELDRARSRLFANVSHEFRTPLTLTMGPLDDIRAGLHGPLTPEAAEQVDLARRNAGRVLDLINEILELARAESGRVTLLARRIDLGVFVSGIARTFLPLAERKAIAFDVQSPTEHVEIYADPDHLDRALSNLLSNAFKFTPDGGAVRVTVIADDVSARITVRDSGPGDTGGRAEPGVRPISIGRAPRARSLERDRARAGEGARGVARRKHCRRERGGVWELVHGDAQARARAPRAGADRRGRCECSMVPARWGTAACGLARIRCQRP